MSSNAGVRVSCFLVVARLTVQLLTQFGMKLLYCSGVWSYVVGALSTPTFIIIPLITIWAGIFPIVISWWAALGLTVYMLATMLVRRQRRQRWGMQRSVLLLTGRA